MGVLPAVAGSIVRAVAGKAVVSLVPELAAIIRMGKSVQGIMRMGARPFLYSYARQNLSGRAVLRKLRARGLGYATGRFYADYRRAKSAVESMSKVAKLAPSKQIAKYLHVDTDWDFEKKYVYRLGYMTRDQVTGRFAGKKWMIVQSNERMTKRDLSSDLEDYLTQDQGTDSAPSGARLINLENVTPFIVT